MHEGDFVAWETTDTVSFDGRKDEENENIRITETGEMDVAAQKGSYSLANTHHKSLKGQIDRVPRSGVTARIFISPLEVVKRAHFPC